MRQNKINPELISSDYAALNTELHKDKLYGNSGWKYANDIIQLSQDNGYKTVLDYGCGKGTFSEALRQKGSDLIVYEYDPAISDKNAEPPAADIVLCSDVLEHVEPEALDSVIAHIATKAEKAAFLYIATRAAKKTLPDGRNAHLTIQSGDWWTEALSKKFDIIHTVRKPWFIAVVAKPL